jgi:hypothetical protein
VHGALHYAAMQLHYYSPGDGHFFKNVLILFNVVILYIQVVIFTDTHAACFVGTDFLICRDSSTSWQLIQPWPCAGHWHNKYFVYPLFLTFSLFFFWLFLSCIVLPALEYHRDLQATSVRYATSWTT